MTMPLALLLKVLMQIPDWPLSLPLSMPFLLPLRVPPPWFHFQCHDQYSSRSWSVTCTSNANHSATATTYANPNATANNTNKATTLSANPMPLQPPLPVLIQYQTECPSQCCFYCQFQCHCQCNYHFCCFPSCVHYTADTSAIATAHPFLYLLTAICKAGTYSPTGLEPCLPCEKGSYQELEGQRLCLKCSPDTTTPEEGSNSSMQCKGTCFLTKTRTK